MRNREAPVVVSNSVSGGFYPDQHFVPGKLHGPVGQSHVDGCADDLQCCGVCSVFLCWKSFQRKRQESDRSHWKYRTQPAKSHEEYVTSASVGCSSRGCRWMFLAIGENKRVQGEFAGPKDQNQQ